MWWRTNIPIPPQDLWEFPKCLILWSPFTPRFWRIHWIYRSSLSFSILHMALLFHACKSASSLIIYTCACQDMCVYMSVHVSILLKMGADRGGNYIYIKSNIHTKQETFIHYHWILTPLTLKALSHPTLGKSSLAGSTHTVIHLYTISIVLCFSSLHSHLLSRNPKFLLFYAGQFTSLQSLFPSAALGHFHTFKSRYSTGWQFTLLRRKL